LILGFGSPAWAAPASIPANSDQQLSVERALVNPEAQECGQDCLYKRAKENLILQAIYTAQKIEILKVEIKSGDPSVVFENLGSFCTPTEKTKSLDGAKDCFNRYQRIQVATLYKIKAATQQTSNMVAKLSSRAPTVANGKFDEHVMDRPFWVERYVEPNTPEKKLHKPFVPTFENLQEDFRKTSQRLKTAGSISYEKWVNTLPFEPAKEDFVKFKVLPPDPSDSSGIGPVVMETDAEGKPVFDKDAYEKASEEFKTLNGNRDADFKAMMETKSGFSLPTAMTEALVGKDSLSEFKNARGRIVDAANKKLTQLKQEHLAFKQSEEVVQEDASQSTGSEKDAVESAQRNPADQSKPMDPVKTKVPEQVKKRFVPSKVSEKYRAAVNSGNTYSGNEDVIELPAGSGGQEIAVTMSPERFDEEIRSAAKLTADPSHEIELNAQ